MNCVIIKELTCPVCGGHELNAEYVQKKLYICEAPGEMCMGCRHVMAFCKKCEKIYDESEFGLHGDVWECKECGTTNWVFTDYMRQLETDKANFEKWKNVKDKWKNKEWLEFVKINR